LLTSRQAEKVNILKQAKPVFARMRSLAMRFRGLLRGNDAGSAMPWAAESKPWRGSPRSWLRYQRNMQSNYEYNLFIIQRTKTRATEKLPTGRVRIEVETGYILSQTGGPLKVAIKVNGKLLAEGYRAGQRAAALYRHDCLDIGIALGSTVSLDDQDKAPFKFNGAIERVNVRYVSPTYGTSVMKRRTLGSPEAIVAVALILVVVGVVTHGFHRSDIERGWQNLFGRAVSRCVALPPIQRVAG
jgi:hypothetical protein